MATITVTTVHPDGSTTEETVELPPKVIQPVDPANVADALSRLLDEFVVAGALTTAKADAIKTQLNGWKQ